MFHPRQSLALKSTYTLKQAVFDDPIFACWLGSVTMSRSVIMLSQIGHLITQ